MVVDDNVDAAHMLGALLEMWEYRCTVANDPLTAIALAKIEPVRAFILDIGMPDMDGYTLGSILHRAYPGAAFIGHSAWNRDSKREQQVGFSFDFFVRKPVGFRELEQLLSLAISQPQTQLSPPAGELDS